MRTRIVLLAVILLALAAPAAAESTTVTLPFTIVSGLPGSAHLLWAGDLPEGVCLITAVEGGNNQSVHLGNDISVSDGMSMVWLRDVERAPGVSTVADGTIEAVGPVDVVLVLGADGLYSADLLLEIECETPPTTTTTEVPPSTITTSTSTTSTTVPPSTSTTTEPTTTTTTTSTSPPTTDTTQPPPSTTAPSTTITVVTDPPPKSPPTCTDAEGVVHPDVDQDGIDDDTGEFCALPYTGAGDLVLIGLGALVLIGMGAAMLLWSARRRI